MTTLKPGQFLCWLEGEGREEGNVIDGLWECPVKAAASAAEDAVAYFDAFYSEIPDKQIVNVEDSAGVVQEFNVTREMEPVYTATEIKES